MFNYIGFTALSGAPRGIIDRRISIFYRTYLACLGRFFSASEVRYFLVHYSTRIQRRRSFFQTSRRHLADLPHLCRDLCLLGKFFAIPNSDPGFSLWLSGALDSCVYNLFFKNQVHMQMPLVLIKYRDIPFTKDFLMAIHVLFNSY